MNKIDLSKFNNEGDASTTSTIPVENLSTNRIATYSTKEYSVGLDGPSEIAGQILDEVVIVDGQNSTNKGWLSLWFIKLLMPCF